MIYLISVCAKNTIEKFSYITRYEFIVEAPSLPVARSFALREVKAMIPKQEVTTTSGFQLKFENNVYLLDTVVGDD